MNDLPGLQIIDVTPNAVTFSRNGFRPVTAYLDELDQAGHRFYTGAAETVTLHGARLDGSDIDLLRATILDHADEATIVDRCRKCGTETTRTDLLCDTCHEGAELLSERIRRQR